VHTRAPRRGQRLRRSDEGSFTAQASRRAEQKGEHYKIWEEIEKQTDMIFKSFAFEKITWNTAEPAKQKAEKAFDGYFDKAEYKGFQTSLEDAAKKFQAAEAACK